MRRGDEETRDEETGETERRERLRGGVTERMRDGEMGRLRDGVIQLHLGCRVAELKVLLRLALSKCECLNSERGYAYSSTHAVVARF